MDIDFSVHSRLFLGLYEIELNEHLRALCSPTANCFDIGGQFGYDALVLAKLSTGRIVSFECDPDACRQLDRNIRMNAGLAERVQVVHAFVTSRAEDGGGCVALDDLIERDDLFTPDFVKMDIEGSEYDALLGAQKLVAQRRTKFLVETHSKSLEDQCLAFFESHGYRTEIVNQRRFLPDYRPTAHNRWLVATPGAAA